MKKLLDRRTLGFLWGTILISSFVLKVNDAPVLIAIIPIAIGAIVTMFGILVGGNVTQAIKEPKNADNQPKP